MYRQENKRYVLVDLRKKMANIKDSYAKAMAGIDKDITKNLINYFVQEGKVGEVIDIDTGITGRIYLEVFASGELVFADKLRIVQVEEGRHKIEVLGSYKDYHRTYDWSTDTGVLLPEIKYEIHNKLRENIRKFKRHE